MGINQALTERQALNFERKTSPIIRSARQIIDGGAIVAAQFLVDVAAGRIKSKNVGWTRMDAAKTVLLHHLGSPKGRVEVSTASGRPMLSYTQIIMLAEGAAGKTLIAPPELAGIELRKGDIVQDERATQWRVVDGSDPQCVRLHGIDSPMASTQSADILQLVPMDSDTTTDSVQQDALDQEDDPTEGEGDGSLKDEGCGEG